jgi:hypothetical protein
VGRDVASPPSLSFLALRPSMRTYPVNGSAGILSLSTPEVPNAIVDVVANSDVLVSNGDEAKPEMTNENEERNDEQLIVDCCDEESSDDGFELID